LCGFSAIANITGEALPHLERGLEVMSHLIAHRGPDGQGTWQTPRGEVGLAHRRLAIIDLTDAAHQPMQDPQGNAIAYKRPLHNG